MVDRLKDAATFLKAKWNKDELTQLLMSAMNDEECQPSTNIMHQIANASYSMDDWPRIWQFVMEKLKSSKGVRVNKGLTVAEFLLKNGNQHIVRDFKEEVRLFRDIEEFKGKNETELRISSIRRKAGTIIQLINNPRRLEEQRSQAEAIKSKLGGNAYTNKTYANNNSKAISSSKIVYEGIGSTYYPPSGSEKQESGITKVTGMASNLVKGFTNKITPKDDGLLNIKSVNQYQNYADLAYSEKSDPKSQTVQNQQKSGKLFQKLNVRKPNKQMGITKVHSNVEPRSKQTPAKQSHVNVPQVDIFELGAPSSQAKPSQNIDLFGINPLITSAPVPPEKIDFLGAESGVSNAQTAKFNSNVTTNSLDIFSFGQMNSGVSNQKQQSSQQSSNFDIFESPMPRPLQIKSQIRMNPVILDSGVEEPKTKYDMFQQFLL